MSAAEPDAVGGRTDPEAAREAARARRKSRPWPVRLAGIALGLALMATASCAAAAAVMLGAYALTTPAARIHTLTDGRRKATFIEMIHVADTAFYGRVAGRIRTEGASGASYLFEGVYGSPEDMDRLTGVAGTGSGMSGINDLQGAMAGLGGLAPQPQFLGLTGRPDVWADLPADRLVAGPHSGLSDVPSAWVANAFLAFAGKALALDPDGHPRLAALLAVRSLVAFGMAVEGLRPMKGPSMGPASARRERRLVEAMEATPGDVVITYGAAHWPGFRRLLCPGWREVSVETNPILR